MKIIRTGCLFFVWLLCVAGGLRADEQDELPGWVKEVRRDRPRMFFNRETLPDVKKIVRNHKQAYYASMLERVSGRPLQADENWGKGANPGFGRYAQEAAFVWLMEGDSGDPQHNTGVMALQKAKNYLKAAVDFYHMKIDSGEAVNWYSASRICALAAYDWIHDELTVEEREYFVRRFAEHHQREMNSGARLTDLNRGGISRGFYGPPNLPWYIGLAFYGDGINDEYACEKLIQGHDQHIELLEYRARAAGEKGGAASVASGYAFQMYPWAEINFMHTYNSATGRSLGKQYDHLSLFPNWVLWNRIPGTDGNKDYGLGDSQHSGNHFTGAAFLEMHMLQIAHLFVQVHPERAALAMWVRQQVLGNPDEHDLYWWPLAPVFAYKTATLPEPQGPDESWPLAEWFPAMGTVFMKSGWKSEDTHAVFVVGGHVNSHRHFDQGHFVIYHKGFQAIDAGTYGNRKRTPHLTEYLVRTVAHNSLLIHAPPEADSPPKVWGGDADTHDGGQYDYKGELVGFVTNDDYTYVAADITAAYHPAKAEKVVRQMVFVHPDIFVIYDRVISTQAGFRKTWLLHTAREPQILADGRTFRAVQDQGALVSRTLLPKDAELVAVGGPGMEFWSAGQNWNAVTDKPFHELWGEWRMEVRQVADGAREEFLHVLRVGDTALKSVGEVGLIENGNHVGVRIVSEGEDEAKTITFNREGETGFWWRAE